MTQRLRRFAGVGLVATALDVGLLLVGVLVLDLIVVVADVIALTAAAAAAFFLHRRITFALEPAIRWVQRPMAIVLSAVVAGAVDVVVLRALVGVTGYATVGELLVAKAGAMVVAGLVRLVAARWVLLGVVRTQMGERTARPAPAGTHRLSLVIPAYREADRIGSTIARVRAELEPLVGTGGLEVVVVDDGSGDGTRQAAAAAGADVVIALPRNRGKGAAVRAGVAAASGRTIAFTDADLSYPPAQVAALLEEVESGWDVVVGSRAHHQTSTIVQARRLREVGGRLINLGTHAVLLGAHRDTQCGLKAFRGDVARSLFARSRIDGFAFDVELFHLAERDGLSLHEVPVQVANAERSSVRLVRDGLVLIRDLGRILAAGRAGLYDVRDPVPDAPTAGAPSTSEGESASE